MKKIVLFVSALKQEMDIIKKEIGKYESKKIGYKFLLTGSWNYNVLYELTNYLNKQKIDFIVNIWVCWKIIDNNSNFIQVYRIKELSNQRESLVPIYFTLGELASIASSNKIITNWEQILGENYVDMESYAIDFISSKEKIGCAIFKVPFDTIGVKSKEVSITDLQKSLEAFPYESLIIALEKYFDEKEEEYDFSKIKEHFWLTFSEVEIVKKEYYKMKAFSWDFEKFYKKNKHLEKKEFMRLLALTPTLSQEERENNI